MTWRLRVPPYVLSHIVMRTEKKISLETELAKIRAQLKAVVETLSRLGEQDDRGSFTIVEWCRRHGISIATYYNLKAAGQAPEEAVVRGRRLVTKEAAAKWRREREEAST